jgi:hypothetical protein
MDFTTFESNQISSKQFEFNDELNSSSSFFFPFEYDGLVLSTYVVE